MFQMQQVNRYMKHYRGLPEESLKLRRQDLYVRLKEREKKGWSALLNDMLRDELAALDILIQREKEKTA